MNNNKKQTLKLADVKEALRAEILVGNDKLDMPVTNGASSDLMSDLLTGPTNGAVLLTGLNNIQVIRTSVIAGVAAVVFVISQAYIIYRARGVTAWNVPIIPFVFTTSSFVTGGGILLSMKMSTFV